MNLLLKKLFSPSLIFQMPVPMLIPSSTDNEDKTTESIEDLNEKLPSHSFEADLLEMAEMIVEDEEKKTLSQGGWYNFKERKNIPTHFHVTSILEIW